MTNKKQIAVIGAGFCEASDYSMAREVGALLAKNNYRVVCGGLGGVMEAACRGAVEKGGETVGILPGDSVSEANQYVQTAIASGMGTARNSMIIRSAEAVIAIAGQFGTLSEIAFALQMGKPLISINSWQVSPEIIQVRSAVEAVEKVVDILKNND